MVFHKLTAAKWAAAAVFGVSLITTSSAVAGPASSCRPVTAETMATEPVVASEAGSEIEQVGFRRKVYCPPCNPQPICPPGPTHEVIPPPPHDSATPTPAVPGDSSATPTPSDQTVPPAPESDVDTDQAVDNFMNQPAVAQPSAQAPTTSLAQASSNPFASAGGQGFAPGMIGDYFGIGPSVGVNLDPFGIGDFGIAPGGANAPQARVGVQKLAESTSPIPQDRLFFNYSFFNNAPIGDRIDVQRFTFGFEKTFNCGQSSIEARLPFAATLQNEVDFNLSGGDLIQNAQLGDLTLYFKQVLRQTCNLTVSGGLGVSIPTSDDVVINEDLVIGSESIHLYPFLGSFYTPTDRLFVTTFMQFDLDVNGNPVFDTATGGSTARLQDRNDLYLSAAVGYWMFKDTCRCSDGMILGVAPQVEFHYNQTISGSDSFLDPTGSFTFAASDRIGLVNATLGMTVVFRNNATMTLGYAAPLNASDRQFDGEARVMFTKFLR